jgi:hypothetical protein
MTSNSWDDMIDGGTLGVDAGVEMSFFAPSRIGRLTMANIAREDNEIVLKLSTGERIIAMHRDVRVPLSAVKSVDVVDEPICRIQGLKPRNFKVFGGYWPGRFAYGSFFDGAVRRLLFAAVNGRKPRGLEIALDDAKYIRLIVSLDHPDAAKTALSA